MSYHFDEGDSVWVSDIDGHINLSGIEYSNRREEEQIALDAEISDLGDIQLLSCKSLHARTLNERGITPPEWRWAMHKADQALLGHHQWIDMERPFLNALLSMGKPYAISRYSKWERIPYASALTATLPHGLRALIEQYLVGDGVVLGFDEKKWLSSALRDAQRKSGITAYERTGMVQAVIHKLADTARNAVYDEKPNKQSTRTILSLARLHFSVSEMKLGSFSEVQTLNRIYDASRSEAVQKDPYVSSPSGRYVKNWSLRHRHPLTYLFPYAIRNAIDRGLHHDALASGDPDRIVVENELALAQCGILLMRREARER